MRYSAITRSHMRAPRNMGILKDANGIGIAGKTDAEFVRIYVRISEDGRIERLSYEAFACPTTRAATSILSEMVKGKPASEILALSPAVLIEAMRDLPANKSFCAELAVAALKKAVSTENGTGPGRKG